MVKGFVKTLEAGIAIALILVSMVFLFPEKTVGKPDISKTGYNCLKYLDYKGTLRHYAINNMEASLIFDLRSCIPPSLDYKAKICSTSFCSSQTPADKEVFLSSYLIAGEDSFKPTLINLWVWSK